MWKVFYIDTPLMKKVFILIIFLFSCTGFTKSYAFMWEDLWLDIYNKIDQGMRTIDFAQYQYELTGQGERNVFEVVNQILSQDGYECEIWTPQEIAILLGQTETNQLAYMLEKCTKNKETITINSIANIQETLKEIQNEFKRGAVDKSQLSYDVIRVWLYYDGIDENSPFDIMSDIQRIDRIIFWERIEYEGTEMIDISEQLWSYFEPLWALWAESTIAPVSVQYSSVWPSSWLPSSSWTQWTQNSEQENSTPTSWNQNPFFISPQYACLPEDDVWHMIADKDDTYSELSRQQQSQIPPQTITRSAPWSQSTQSWPILPWAYPEPWPIEAEDYEWVGSPWPCDDTFCIKVTTEKSQYGIVWRETRSILDVSEKTANHCFVAANTSLTQRKKTTNNFELGSIIEDLPSLLRGMNIYISSKPIPSLDVTEHEAIVSRSQATQEVKKQLISSFNIRGLEYDRENDIVNFTRYEYELKSLYGSDGLSLDAGQSRFNDYLGFQEAYNQEAQKTAVKKRNALMFQDMQWFNEHFLEIERTSYALWEKVDMLASLLDAFLQVPTRRN